MTAQVVLPPELYEGDQPSVSFKFYENKGQLIGTNGALQSDLKYYTMNSRVNLYLDDEGISSVWKKLEGDNDPDTLYRIDMNRYNSESTTSLQSFNKSDDYLNYYLAHTPNKGITYVYCYERIVYSNYFENIDYHLYSNQSGAKQLFVAHPGSNPSNMELQFSGHDSLVANTPNLEMYLDGDMIILPVGVAYEVTSSGQVIPLAWTPTFIMTSSDRVKFTIGAYNSSNTLVIMFAMLQSPPPPNAPNNLEWNTYYGGNGEDFFYDIDNDASDNTYITGYTGDPATFPHTTGTSQTIGQDDGLLVKFDSDAIRQWATYYGGSNADLPWRLLVTGTKIYTIGNTKSLNLPTSNPANVVYNDNTYNGGLSDALIGRFKDDGTLDFLTYFGSNVEDQGWDLATDNGGNIYAVGHGKIPIVGVSNPPTGRGFIAKFNSNFDLVWSSQFGNWAIGSLENKTFVYGIDIDNNGNMFLGGQAKAGELSLVNTYGSTTLQQSHGGDMDGFIAKLSPSGVPLWVTYYGGNDLDWLKNIKVTNSGEVYVVGSAISTNIPLVGTNTYNHTITSGFNGILARFTNNGVPLWRTYYGGDNTWIEDIDFDDDEIPYIVGLTGAGLTSTSIYGNAYFFQPYKGADDVLLAAFDKLDNSILWQTYMGGIGSEGGFGISLIDDGSKVYITGFAESTSQYPWKDLNVNSTSDWYETMFQGGFSDGFVARFWLYDYGTTTVSTSIKEAAFKATISPTITTNYLRLMLEGEQQSYQVKILSLQGQILTEKQYESVNTIKEYYYIDLPKGMYFLSISDGKHTSTHKFIVQ